MKKLCLVSIVCVLLCFAFVSCEEAVNAPAKSIDNILPVESLRTIFDPEIIGNIGPVVWNSGEDIALAVDIGASRNSVRKNASGIKITSHAHNDDFPGIYFIWDSKQKDSGYLKVDAAVFDLLKSFTLTTKESNEYWDLVIALQDGQELSPDNCYVFFIPHAGNNKNINMVFIDEWAAKEIGEEEIIEEEIIEEEIIEEEIIEDESIGEEPIELPYSISAGYSYTVAVSSDGSLWAWGQNSYGQLGDGTTDSRSNPVRIGSDNDWANVATGNEHTIATKTDGSLWAWGRNNRWQIGDGTTINRSSPVRIGSDNDWDVLVAGSDYNLAIKTDTSLWGWGYNGSSQLGNDSKSNSLIPIQIGTDTGWVSLAASNGNSLGIKADGSIWGWGNNINGQLGDGTTRAKPTPTRIGTDDDWAAIAKGNGYTIALKIDGSLWAWGTNGSGQLGDGTTSSKTAPVRIGTDNDWVVVSTKGAGGTKALKKDGSMWAWGSNLGGTLGDGTTTNRNVPTQIGIDSIWVAVFPGYSHTIACRLDGSFWAWGSNSFGQFGDGTTTNSRLPVEITLSGETVIIPPQEVNLLEKYNISLTSNIWNDYMPAWSPERSSLVTLQFRSADMLPEMEVSATIITDRVTLPVAVSDIYNNRGTDVILFLKDFRPIDGIRLNDGEEYTIEIVIKILGEQQTITTEKKKVFTTH